MSKLTEIILISLFGAAIWGSGWQAKSYQVQSQAIKQERINNKSVIKIESIVYQKKIEIQYKTKIVKEYIHDKESSDIDVNINGYWVRGIDAASQNTSPESVNAASESTPISRIVSSVADNYASCNYDKERLRQFQQWAKDNNLD